MDWYVHLWLCVFFFYSSNVNLLSKLKGNKFVWNLLVQQYLIFFFKVHKHLSQKLWWLTTWANCSCLPSFLSFRSCSTNLVIVCALLSTTGLLTFLAQGVLAAVTHCQFVNSDHSEPEKLGRVSFLVWLAGSDKTLSTFSYSADFSK